MILSHAGVVPGYDLTSEAALTKLSYLLAMPGITSDEVMKQMSISLRGEHTEHSHHVFEHPSSQLSPPLASLSALGYAVANGQIESVQEILINGSDLLLNEADYSGNTPMVGLPKSHAALIWATNAGGVTSTWLPLDLTSISYVFSWRGAPLSICVTKQVAPPYFWPPMPYWKNMWHCFVIQAPIFTPRSSALRSYMPSRIPPYGRLRV